MATYDDLVALDHAHLLHPQHHPSDHAEPIIFQRGEGAILWDVRGRRYIDGLSSLWNVNVGHGRRELGHAAARQMADLGFANSYVGSSTEVVITLAARLAALSPRDAQGRQTLRTTFFTTGGGESNDTAFKTARFYWTLKGKPEKTKIVSRVNGYHGNTMGATAATGLSAFHPRFGPIAQDFIHVPPMDPEILEETIQREGPETVAAVIAEPVQGAGGVYPPPDDYFPRLREICDEYEVLFIADEVITGFGRLGTFWGVEQWGVVPDIISFAKGITSGYQPLGGVMFSDEIRTTILEQPPTVKYMHAFTYWGHPVCCAVAHANLDIFEREQLVQRAAQIAPTFQQRLAVLRDDPFIKEVRGRGLMAGIELQPDAVPGSAGAVIATLKQRGVFTRFRADSICLAPPLVIKEEELTELCDTVISTVREMASKR